MYRLGTVINRLLGRLNTLGAMNTLGANTLRAIYNIRSVDRQSAISALVLIRKKEIVCHDATRIKMSKIFSYRIKAFKHFIILEHNLQKAKARLNSVTADI